MTAHLWTYDVLSPRLPTEDKSSKTRKKKKINSKENLQCGERERIRIN